MFLGLHDDVVCLLMIFKTHFTEYLNIEVKSYTDEFLSQLGEFSM